MTSEVVLPIPPFVASAAVDDASSSTPSSSSLSPPARPPRRKIFTEADLAPWFRSNAYADLERTILRMTAAVQGKSNKVECVESEVRAAALLLPRRGYLTNAQQGSRLRQPTKKLVAFLRRSRDWVAETPLAQGPQRFGNKAFRDWLGRLEQAESVFQRDLLDTAHVAPSLATAALPELSFHLLSSFGSPQRLDYGTGHELSFLCYLVTLCRLRVFAEPDELALVVRVFAEYIELCRQVQKVFRLEPAGSKGVWGLDDHQHLVYLFGASQLVGHPKLRPASLLNATDIASHAPSSLFLSSIAHIHALKRGPFHEHSPLLHQIATTVPSWHKVTKGLWDMYKVEVLGKVPVVQHCRFGEVGMRWTDQETGKTLPSSGEGRADDEEE
ncbi:Phosphotyrosyl phosphatase activator, partial [Rhodotorula sp. JG-1b]